MRKQIISCFLLLTSSVHAQVSPENDTPFWKTCTFTAAHKELSGAFTRASKEAEQCGTEREAMKAQNRALAEELAKVKADLESAREETKAASTSASEWRVYGADQLKKALTGSTMSFAYFKRIYAAACPATVQDFFVKSSDFSTVNSFDAGARAQSSTCGALAWCSSAADKDGDPYLLISVYCTDGSEGVLRDRIKNVANNLR